MAFLGAAAAWGLGAAKKLFGGAGDAASDFAHAGDPHFHTGPAYQVDPNDMYYGGQYGADNLANYGITEGNQAGTMGNYYNNLAQQNRGAQAWENQDLSDQEAQARGYDQQGALQLMREAALGNAPSAAQMQMQQGLNSALASQQAISGGARGAGGIAMAGANAAAQAGNLQQNAFTQGAQLRAQEMAEARGAYGSLASQIRAQDQARLQQASGMSQFNANLNDQYRLGMGQLGNAYGNQQQGWYGAAMHPYDQQAQLDLARQQINSGSYSGNQALSASEAQARADAARADQAKVISLAGTTAQTGAGIAGSLK